MSTGNNLEEIYDNSIKILKDLIAFKTVSGENNTQLIDYCDNILNSLGAVSFKTYDEEEKRVNLFATIKAKKESNKKPIILSGHTDVVPVSKGWVTDPFEATIKEDKLFGRGSCDMKGFIACTLAYAPIFSSSNLDFLNVLPEPFKLVNKNNHQAEIQILNQTPASDLIRFLLDKSDIKAFEEKIPTINEIFIRTVQENES